MAGVRAYLLLNTSLVAAAMPFCLVENLKNMGMLKNFPIYIND
jgi:hypothetical protein